MLSVNREVLSDWVKLQLDYEGSARVLAKKIGVHWSTVIAWKDGTTDRISEKNIAKISRYRGETLTQTIAWLDDGKAKEHELIEELRKAPPEVLVQAFLLLKSMSIIGIFGDKLPTVNYSVSRMCSPVGRLIIEELEASVRRREFADFPSALARFCEMCAFAYPDRDIPLVLALLDGRCLIAGEGIIGSVAIALEEFSGNPRYTLRYLQSIQTETPTTEWDEGCEREQEIVRR